MPDICVGTHRACVPHPYMRAEPSCSNGDTLLTEMQVLKCLLQDQEVIYHLDFELEYCKEETFSLHFTLVLLNQE